MASKSKISKFNFDIPEDFQEEFYHKELYKTIRDNKKVYAITTFSRAIPYFKDGLIDVYRRSLWSMYKQKLFHNGPTKKSAKVVGDIIANWHPHGDAAVYQAVVTLAKDYTNHYPLIQGQGNWGNILGDGAAAYRYTECKLSEFFSDVCEDIKLEYVDFMPNFSGEFREPKYIPFKIPILLINGSYGIADSYLTSIPPHNLNDTIELCKKYIANKQIRNEVLVDGYYPDFCNYGIILNKSEIERAYKTCCPANIKMKATVEIDRINNTITIKDLPHTVVKTNIVKTLEAKNRAKHAVLSKITNLVENKVERNGELHMEFEVVFDKNSNILEIARELEKHCLSKTIPLSFIYYDSEFVHNITIKNIIEQWYNTLYTTKIRKISFQTSELSSKKHVYEGMLKIYDYMDEIIAFIKKSSSQQQVIEHLSHKYGLTNIQSKAISEMKLMQLNNVSKDKIICDIQECERKIKELDERLYKIDEEIIIDLNYIQKKYGRPRRTILLDIEESDEEKSNMIVISNGSIIWSHNQYAIFDLQNIINGKTLTNGLKSIKIDGKFTKEFIGCHGVKDNIIGILILTNDRQARRIEANNINALNNWISISDNPVINQVLPIYNENDSIIILSNENKIRKLNINLIGKQPVKIGDVKIAQIYDPNCDKLLLVSKNGEYHYIDIAEIPELNSRTGMGNVVNIKEDDVYMVQINSQTDNTLTLSIIDDENYSYLMKFDKETIVNTNRNSKPKKLMNIGDDFVIRGVDKVNILNKEDRCVLIGKYSASQISIQNIRTSNMDTIPKKIPVQTLGIVQYNL